MNELFKKKCVPCEGGVPALDISEIHKYQKKIDGWDVVKNEKNIHFLEKKFTFKNFVESQKFVNEVGRINTGVAVLYSKPSTAKAPST